MPRTPGVVIPSPTKGVEEVTKDVVRRGQAAGFIPIDLEAFLAHYGVKGMKWGKRKSASSEPEKPSSSDHTQSRELLKQPTRVLSNAEIRKVNERLQLERSLSDLSKTTGSKNRLKKGEATADRVLNNLGRAKRLYDMATSPAGKEAIKQARRLLA